MLTRTPSADRGKGVRAREDTHEEAGPSCLGRMPCRVQRGQQVISGLQPGDQDSVRKSRNVIFVETPSVMPEQDLVIGFDKGDFTYDEYDDGARRGELYLQPRP